MYAGLVNWSYALHYQFRMNDDKLKILVGPMLDLNGGVVYNRRNSNNPAQAKAYGGWEHQVWLSTNFTSHAIR